MGVCAVTAVAVAPAVAAVDFAPRTNQKQDPEGDERTALSPAIEATKAVGLVVLPGAMTGLILAGVDPLDAVLVQAVVMYLILGATATTATVVALGLQRRLFTHDHRLVRIPKSGA